MKFTKKLERAWAANDSLLCVGLYPDHELAASPQLADWLTGIIEATADVVCAYKFNLAFYEAMGLEGYRLLQHSISMVCTFAPDAIRIGDGKRGDVEHSAKRYAKAMFEVWGFDAITVNPWLDSTSIEPFLEDESYGVFAPFADSDISRVYSERPNLGIIVPANRPTWIDVARHVWPTEPLLIPGIGSQCGDLQRAVRHGVDTNGKGIIVSASRSVIYASQGPDFAEAARAEAIRLMDAINQERG